MNAPFSQPRRGIRFEDCTFYHTIDIPSRGLVRGQWDLRGHVDEYLGGYNFAGKRVLEIGPASGFLTFEMEPGAPKWSPLKWSKIQVGISFHFPMSSCNPFLASAEKQ